MIRSGNDVLQHGSECTQNSGGSARSRAPTGTVSKSAEEAGVGADVDHRDRGAALQPSDQFEQEGGRGLALGCDGVAALGVAGQDAVRRNAAEVEPVARVRAEGAEQGLAEGRLPVALEREDAPQDVGRRLRLIRALSVRDRQASAVQAPDARDLLLRVVDLTGVDDLLGLEGGVHALRWDDDLPLVAEDEGRVLPVEDLSLKKEIIE